jgi:hypothetical protein
VITLDAIVGVEAGVVERVRDQFFDNGLESSSEISDDFVRLIMSKERSGEERSGRFKVASARDVHVYDLPALIDGAVDAARHAARLDGGLVHEPASTNRVSAWSGSIDE